MAPDFLTLPDRRLAYQQRRAGGPEKAGIVFLGGYASDMTGSKASFLAEQCAAVGRSFLRFDYQGHGQSSGDFKDGTIGGWADDARLVFDALTEGPQILVGSSMGGWLALLLARARPERVVGVVGVAAAPDFTEDLIWDQLTASQKEKLQREGLIYDEQAPPDHNPPLTLKLVEEARAHLVLRSPLTLACPVYLLQGMRDTEVPWRHVMRLTACLTSDKVRVTLVKDGDHRLSRPEDLDLLWESVRSFDVTLTRG